MDEETKIEIVNEEQRNGNIRETKINRGYIASNEYRRKFDQITQSKDINRILYQKAKKSLFHRSGTVFEDMYWIDAETGEVFAEETANDYEKEVKYSNATKRAILEHQKIITIHNHPDSFPPSENDFNSNYLRGYYLGIIACHDGRIYMYSSDELLNEDYYQMKVADYKRTGYTEDEAQRKTIEELQRNFDIKCKEVKNHGNGK